MKHPPYHLRPNKAVDRLRLIEILKCLQHDNSYNLSKYTYYAFGGPFLEDFRILAEFFPEIKMVSIENNPDTFKRQKFHKPQRNIKLTFNESDLFIKKMPENKKIIFWLDYIGFEPAHFQDFINLLKKAALGSIVKITLQAQLENYPFADVTNTDDPLERNNKENEWMGKFTKRFGKFIPAGVDFYSFQPAEIVGVIQRMLQIASQKAFDSSPDVTFQILDSCYYADKTQMFCLVGMVCNVEEGKNIKRLLKKCQFANLDWGKPGKIDIPILSTKERLRLERHLPRTGDSGKALYNYLGYNIEDKEKETIQKLKQYADFSKYIPYFVKAAP